MLKAAVVEADANVQHMKKRLAQENNLESSLIFATEVENEANSDIVVEKIKKIIAGQYSKRLTTEKIAEQVNYSKKQAQRIFLNKTEKTIYEYLTEYRIEKAKELLKEGKSKIYATAEQVGYKNTLHFKKLFEKHTGLTPAEYKKQNK